LKKIFLSSLVASTLLLSAQTPEELNAQITKNNAQIEELKAEVAQLTAQLPINNAFITHTELGFIMTSGNTETVSYNADLAVSKRFDAHKFKFTFNGQYAYDNTDGASTEIKNQYLTELTYNYDISDFISFTYLNGFKQDKFSNFDYQFYTGPGMTYKAIVSDSHNLEVETNFLYSVDNIVGKNSPEKDEYTAYRAKALYSWQIFDNLKFDEELSYRGSLEQQTNYFAFSKSMITNKINDILSAGISYTMDYVNESGDAEHTDSTLSISIIIDY